MFKGKHSIEFKPLTIFTGTNNSGKSTLLSLTEGLVNQFGDYIGTITPYIKNLYPLKNKTSGTRVRLEADNGEGFDDSFIYIYYLKNLVLNDINASFHSEVTDLPGNINFCLNNEAIISYDPHPSELSDNVFYCTLSVNFDKIYNLLKSERSTNKGRRMFSILEDLTSSGLPDELFRTTLVDKPDIGSIFYMDPTKRWKDFNIRIFDSEYNYITNTRSNDFFFFYVNNVLNSILNNRDLDNGFRQSFYLLLKFILFNYFLFPLKGQIDNYKNLINLSAYKGKFINETKSQAYEILASLLDKQSELKSEEAWARYFKNKELENNSDYRNEKNYFGSRLEFLKRWINEFGLGTSIKFEKKPVNLMSLLQVDKSKRYPFELGFGNQQFLPILLSFCITRNGLFLIEEPESHLHPNLQSKLADFFTDALNMDKNAQFIIETHSEYFIRKLQFLIAKRKIDKDFVALYYIHNSKSIPKGSKQIQRMEIRDDGIIKQEFGSGFFDESAYLAMDLLNFEKSN